MNQRFGKVVSSRSRAAVAAFVLSALSGLGTSTATGATVADRATPPHAGRPFVGALDLSRPPSRAELVAAGQLGGPLSPTHQVSDRERERAMNLAFGRAIDAWNRHDWQTGLRLFAEHIEAYPDSPWAAEAELHLGCDATYKGRYTEAEQRFEAIIEQTRTRPDPGAKVMLDKARSRLALVSFYRSDIAGAKALFEEVQRSGHGWRERTYAAHWVHRLGRLQANRLAALSCGTRALSWALARQGRESEAREVLSRAPDTRGGHSLVSLASIAASYGLGASVRHFATSDLALSPFPAVVHLRGRGELAGGHYWVAESAGEEGVRLYDPQAERSFLLTTEELEREWTGDVLLLAAAGPGESELPGMPLSEQRAGEVRGGCCGAARAESDLGDPGANAAEDWEGGSCQAHGAPAWSVNMVSMNLVVRDVPLWYFAPVGPPVEIQLTYNSQAGTTYLEPFGNKWSFNYSSYLVEDTGGQVTVFRTDGRRDLFTPTGGGQYQNSYRVFDQLTKVAENEFTLRTPLDEVYSYAIPVGTGSLQPLLVEIRDATGQSLFFDYDSEAQLNSITDAVGNTTTFTTVDGLVTEVHDPFGRSAAFEYDANRNLVRITDMAGYWTELEYDSDVYLTALENARGRWTYSVEPADGIPASFAPYPEPGGGMWENYRITITDPLDGHEEFYYAGGLGAAQAWRVSPRHYVAWKSDATNNFASDVPRTKYSYSTTASGRGEISKIEFPGGGHVEYGYDPLTGDRLWTKDSHGHTKSFTYNAKGYLTSETDAVGTLTTLGYAPTLVDLVQVADGRGAVNMTYDSAHHVTSVTDRLGFQTTITYDSFGRVQARTDPSSVVEQFTYGPDQFLGSIARDAKVVRQVTHDAAGRIVAETDASGLTRSYQVDDLNRVTKVTYPDASFVAYTFGGCCTRQVTSITDRAGRVTSFEYDALERLVRIARPDGGLQRFSHDADGNLIAAVDANGHRTEFEYDAAGRLVEKRFADASARHWTWDGFGLLLTRTNARGVVSTFSYDANHNLTSVSHSDGTPPTSYVYDSWNRPVQAARTGLGAIGVTWDADSRMTAWDGPWNSDNLTLSYDSLGRILGVSKALGETVTYQYDSLSRLTSAQIGPASYQYTYSGSSPLVASLTRPSGGTTAYAYDSLSQLTSLSNETSTSSLLGEFQYAYDVRGLRTSETETLEESIGTLANTRIGFHVDEVNALVDSTPPAVAYLYDADGNLTQGVTPDGHVFSAVYDADDHLASIEYSDGGTIHRREFTYYPDGYVATVKTLENAVPIGEARLLRHAGLILQERDGANSVQNEYLWGVDFGGGIGGALALRRGGATSSYLYDGKGNVRAVLDDATESVSAAYAYDPFGRRMSASGALQQRLRFSSKPYDEGTGLVDFGLRFYLPALGRWASRDPVGEQADDNLYRFVRNDPVNLVDPDGTTCYYRQSTGHLWCRDSSTGAVTVNIPNAFSGGAGSTSKSAGYKNPKMQGVEGKGPIPRGYWQIGENLGQTNLGGPDTFQLLPAIVNDLWAPDFSSKRGKATSFYIHSGRKSKGCIVAPKGTPLSGIPSGDTLIVIE